MLSSGRLPVVLIPPDSFRRELVKIAFSCSSDESLLPVPVRGTHGLLINQPSPELPHTSSVRITAEGPALADIIKLFIFCIIEKALIMSTIGCPFMQWLSVFIFFWLQALHIRSVSPFPFRGLLAYRTTNICLHACAVKHIKRAG